MTDAVPRTAAQRGDIQGLRAVAVGTVVLAHAGVVRLEGGFVGVDVFFVISGFLITGILTREVAGTGRVSMLDFYARRARRILPAASVTLVAIVIASWIAFGYIRLNQVLHDVVWAALFGANIDLARARTDYFATDTFQSPVQHFWSLAVEEQFYLMLPALIAVLALVFRRRTTRAITLTLLALVVLSFAWSVHRTAQVPTSAYFSTFTRGWELGAGALLALGARYVHQLTRGFCSLLSWIGLGLILWSCVAYTAATPFPGSAAVVPVLGAVLVLAGGIRETPRGASLLLDRAPLRRLGDISYSLYLVHWPVLTIPAMAGGGPLSGSERAALVALAVTLAALSHRFVETPFRTAGFWAGGRRRALALWPVAVALVLSTTVAVGTQAPTATASLVVLDPQQTGQQTGQQVDVRRALDDAASRAEHRDPIPAALIPSPLDLIDANWRLPHHCWIGVGPSRHDICTFGDPEAERTVALFGDSHIGMWTEAISAIAKARGWKVYLFLKTGCPPIDTTMWRIERQGTYTDCNEYLDWAYRQLARLRPDRIVTTGYLHTLIADPSGTRLLADNLGPGGTRALAAGMASSMRRLTAIAPDVTVLADTTTLPETAADCIGRKGATLKTCAVGMDPVTAARNARWKRITEADGGHWVETSDWLCPDGICPLVVGNVIVYTDRHHLTRTMARELEPLLAEALRL